MQVFNGVNSKNVGTISRLINMSDTLLLSSIPDIESNLIHDVDSFIYSIRRNESKDAQDIMYKYGIKLNNSAFLKVRDLVLRIKKRSDHIKAVGYILKLGGKADTNIVIEYSTNSDSDALLLIACILDMLYSKITIYSIIDLNRTNFIEICGITPEKYDHSSMLSQRFLAEGKRITSSKNVSKDDSASEWILSQTNRNSPKKSEESWIQNRTVSKEKTFVDMIKGCIIPKYPIINVVNTDIYGFCSENVKESAYYRIKVDNSNKTIEINKKFLGKLNELSKNKISTVLNNRDTIMADVNQSDSKYRKLSDAAYDLIKYWRRKFIEELDKSYSKNLMYMLAKEYSKYITDENMRKSFVYAIMQLYDAGYIKIESGLVWHNIFLSAVYRINNMTPGIFGSFIIACGTEALSKDAEIFLMTLAMYSLEYKAFKNVVRFEDVSFIPTSYKEITDRAIDETITDKEKISTIAHEASKEMDVLLFNGETPGLYRDNQFKRNITLVMSTIFEELESLWNCQNMVRPGFKTEDNIVTIPTLFANVKGVGARDNSDYIECINKLATDNEHCHLLINQHLSSIGNDNRLLNSNFSTGTNTYGYSNYTNYDPIFGGADEYLSRYSGLFLNGNLDSAGIKRKWGDNYSRLSIEKQQLILTKITEACKNIGKLYNVSYEQIINRALNLPNDILKDITWFDFTKSSPKVVMLFTGDTTLNTDDCISLYILNLIGFDIAVFTPTNYIGLESCLNGDLYQEYFLGEPKFDIVYSKKIQKKSFMSRLFGM